MSVWTGSELVVFGRGRISALKSHNVAAAYGTSVSRWRRLVPPPGPTGAYQGRTFAVWTGHEMLVWGPFTHLAFNPLRNRWRSLPPSPLDTRGPPGIVVWSGREMIGWGGGCCGDAFSDGAAYDPAANSWRKLARSPLAASQSPQGAWTGRQLVVFVGGTDPDGNAWPAQLARAAAYNPMTDTWRRIATPPTPRFDANVVWDGHEVLVVGGVTAPHGGRPGVLNGVGLAYMPTTNRWRRLRSMGSGRTGATAVWTGKRLLVWGGRIALAGEDVIPPHGLAYDPGTNRWSPLPQAPLLGRIDPIAAWTGHSMFVWGGAAADGNAFADGAVFRPTTP